MIILTFTEKTIIDSGSSFKEIRLEFPDHQISDIGNSQVYLDDMALNEVISDSDNLKFGQCVGSLFKIRVADFTEDIANAKMNVYIHYINVELGEVDLEFGKYIVKTVERTSDRRWRDISAVDYMELFDINVADWYNNTMFIDATKKYTLKEFRDALCGYVGVQFEDVTLPNDDMTVGKTVNSQSLNGRELLEMICELNCCFGHFGWDGILKFVRLTNDGDAEVISSYVQGGCQYEDYDIEKFNTIVIQNENGEDAITYNPTQAKENRYVISNNMLVFNKVASELEVIASNILSAIGNITYRVNNTKVFGKAYIPLGQRYEVKARTYLGIEEIDTTFQSFVLKRTIEGIQSMFSTLEATGDRYSNNVRDVSSEIASLRNKTEVIRRELDAVENKVSIFLLYDNEKAYLVKADKSQIIIDIPFYTIRKSYIAFHSSVIFTIATNSEETTDIVNFNDGKAEFQFVVNDLPIPDYIPKVTYQDGTYTIHLDWSWFNEIIDETLEQKFQVICTVKDCEVTIPTFRIHGYLTGDGLYVSSEWDGKIYAEDTFELLRYVGNTIASDTASVSTQTPLPATTTDRVGKLAYRSSIAITNDSVSDMIGMIFTTIVNLSLLTYTATITNNTFVNGEVVTPNIYDIQSINVMSNGVAYYVSFDSCVTWVAYTGSQWVEGSSMTATELENVPTSAWQSPAMIKAVIDEESSLTKINIKGGHI